MLVPFSIDELRQCRGVDRALALRRFGEWRERERKRDRVEYSKVYWFIYRRKHADIIKNIKERYKRKKYIQQWFLMTDNYIKG